MFKIGLSTTGKDINEELFSMYAEAGIEMMEISTNERNYDSLDYRGIKKYADNYGVKLWSFHLPFRPFATLDIASFDEQIRKQSVKYTAELIKKAADIGFDKYIVHAGAVFERTSTEVIDGKIEKARQSYAELAEIAEKEGGVVVVENLPPLCVGMNIDEVEKLVSADDRLKMCFDTNHLLPGDPIEFIKHFKDRIVTIHVSDYDKINERHWLPGEGVVNFYEIYKALKEVNYTGPWLYEIGFVNGSTIDRNRPLICHDFVKNAKEIFENKPLTVIPGVKLV